MKRITSLIICCFLVATSLAQTAWPIPYEIKNDTASIQRLDILNFQLLEDKAGKWTFEDISKSPLNDKFHAKGTKAEGIDSIGVRTIWRRFILKNLMNADAKITIAPRVNFYDIYIKRGTVQWQHFRTGFSRPWKQRDGLKATDAENNTGGIPVILAPGEEIMIYDRRQRLDDYYFNSGPNLFSTNRVVQKDYIDHIHTTGNIYGPLELTEVFMIGFLLVAFFYNFMFYRVTREPVYLYFSLFILFLSVIRLWNVAYLYFRHEEPVIAWNMPYLGYAWAFINFFLLQFIRHFFKTFERHRRLDKFIFTAGIFWALLCATLFITQIASFDGIWKILLPVYLIMIKFLPLSLLISLFFFIKKTDRLGRFVIAGAFPLLFLNGVIAWGIEDDRSPIFTRFFAWLTGNDTNFRILETSCVLWFVLFFALVLFIRYNTLRKKNAQQQLDNERLAKEKEIERNELISLQKTELEKQVKERTAELNQSLEDLKSTQSLLIQSEKMASLGELTAGIAHEIQNPLNFVNNFSEVNAELTAELTEEIDKGNIDQAKLIAADIRDNQEKITSHGKRADAIVKGMLQHSRSSNGLKSPTDLNSLVDEYLRLSYHGLRAKDKSFNATINTNFDQTIPTMNIVAQDIGRAILNLITNAFYAVTEKKSQLSDSSTTKTPYQPTVSVSTELNDGMIAIIVKDNGPGIPQKIIDKIFQPFFTTKPTGQGTGLGLSLSYDIIKAHQGTLTVETKEGEETTFIINLPAQ